MSFLVPSGRKSVAFSDAFREFFGGRLSATGKAVNVSTALEVSTVFACIRVVAEGVAQVPLNLMRESPDGKSRLKAKDHPLYDILKCKPNYWQTSFEFRELLILHAALVGNFYAFKNIVSGNKIKELIPLDPLCVQVDRDNDGVLTYLVTSPNGKQRRFPQEAIWHVRGPSWDGVNGIRTVDIAREAIGLAMATEEQHARMHKNGVRNSGVYSVTGTLSPQQYKDLKNWIDAEMAGLENAGKAMLLDRDAKWLNTSMSGVDAQHLQTREHQIAEICRFFRVLPIMVGYSDKAATYATAEQMFLAHVVHTLSPWYQRLEQSIDANLLTTKERADGYYSQFVEEGLLRGSIEATSVMLDKYVNGGLMTPNEGRAKLDMNPDSSPESDKLRVPANIVGKPPATQGAANGNQNA
jgi:HK97 family phage portal protein